MFERKLEFGTAPALKHWSRTNPEGSLPIQIVLQAIRLEADSRTKIRKRSCCNHMSDHNESVKTGWSSVQVYTFSIICLLIGLAVGYLFRGSTAPRGATIATASTAATATPATAATAAKANGQPAQPSPEDMKRMAEKQVAPLLEQLRTNPKDAETLAKVGYYYMLSSQYADAETYYAKAAELKPTAGVYTALGSTQMFGGKPDKAIASLNHALQLDPKFADALLSLGVLKWRAKGDTKGAIACWETLLKTNPNHPHLDKVRQLIEHVKTQGKAQAPVTE